MEYSSTTLMFYVFIMGVILGFIVNKTNFCTMGAVSDWVNIGDTARFKSWMLAASIAILGVTVLEYFDFFDVTQSRPPYRGPVFFWPRYVLGGLLFGIGMTFASGCGNKVLIRIGGGNIKSIIVLLIAGVMAYLMNWTDFYGLAFHSWMRPISPDLRSYEIADQSLPTILMKLFSISGNDNFRFGLGILVAFLMMYFIFRSGNFRNFDNILSGVTVGLVVVLAWLLTGGDIGKEWIENNNFMDIQQPSVGIQSFTFINPMSETLVFIGNAGDMFYLTFGVTALLSVILGSFIYAIFTKSFRVEWFASSQDFIRHLIGGTLIGIGGVLSLGCTIGQGVTGISTLAIGSFITLISIIIGASITMKIEYYKAVYDDSSFLDQLRASLADLKLLPDSLRKLDKI